MSHQPFNPITAYWINEIKREVSAPLIEEIAEKKELLVRAMLLLDEVYFKKIGTNAWMQEVKKLQEDYNK